MPHGLGNISVSIRQHQYLSGNYTVAICVPVMILVISKTVRKSKYTTSRNEILQFSGGLPPAGLPARAGGRAGVLGEPFWVAFLLIC